MTLCEGCILILQIVCTFEAVTRGAWWKVLYWFGALLLTVAIVKGMKI